MAQAKQDMGTGSIKKLMLQLMIPAVVAQVVNLLYNIVDRIYIGHIAGIGAAALTGVGLFTPILMLLNAFAMLVGAGGAPRTAIALGQGDRQQAEKIISNSFTVLMFFAVVLTFHFVCFCWIFFRNSTFEASVTMIRQIFTAFHPELLEQLLTGYWKVFALMGVGFLLHFCPDSWQNACSRGMVRMPLIAQALIMIALIYLVIQVKSSDIQPFIYFQF